jgi:hypothetical protein
METKESYKCLLCRHSAEVLGNQNGFTFVQCPRCGRYGLSLLLQSAYKHGDGVDDWHLVSGMIHRRWEQRADDDWTAPSFESPSQFAKFAADAPRRVPDRARSLLDNIERLTKHLGHMVSIPEADLIPFAFATRPFSWSIISRTADG